MDSYNLLVESTHGLTSHFVQTNIDLIAQYKDSLLQGKGYVMWEDGVIDYSRIVGITRQPKPVAPKAVT